MAQINEIVLVAVAKEDFEMFNNLAEALLCMKYPTKRTQINAVRQFVQTEFEQFQIESNWYRDLESTIERNEFHPKLLRRQSI
jgi:hypothetical protein